MFDDFFLSQFWGKYVPAARTTKTLSFSFDENDELSFCLIFSLFESLLLSD